MPSPRILAVVLLALLTGGPAQAAPPEIAIQNRHFRYGIGTNAQNLEFTVLATGQDLLRTGAPSACASVRRQGITVPATAASLQGDRLTLRFGEPGVEAELRVETHDAFVSFAVVALRGEVEALTFLQVPLNLPANPGDPFAACTLSLNLATRVDALPVLQRDLTASAERKFGIVGARAAVVATTMDRILPALQQALTQASELPVCRVAGPWAHEIPFNHGSYLFNFGSLTESNLTEWIETTRRVGFTQIDNHGGGGFFRFGDFELDRKKWPGGWDDFRRIVARLHEAGIGSIFHTYAFFIDKASRYVTPVPDARLDAFRTFTLAEPVSAEATALRVLEPTTGMSTVTGFFEHNSVVLHLGDELVTFSGISKEPPWTFTGVKRGAHGTRPAAHATHTKARHLKECFGLFVPDPESTLFEEIAANHADIVNHCGFDGVYLDAIDGSSILRGNDEVWYWANKFVVEIQKRLRKPVGMEMSAMWHHFWQYRTRWQAWDYPQRGHKRFIDRHAAAVHGGLMLPLHLGWWGFQAYNPPQVDPIYPDVMEYLGAKLIGWDAGISLTAGVDHAALRKTPLFARAAEILRTCEELRHAGVFDDRVKARLREPGQGFTLATTPDGARRFKPVDASAHTVVQSEPWSHAWSVTNARPEQPLRFRIEALPPVVHAPATPGLVLARPGHEAPESWRQTAAMGVRASLTPRPGDGPPMGLITAAHDGQVPRNAAWVRFEKRFEPTLDARDARALAVDVEGDGSGALLAIRLESPRHIAHGAIADRYVPIDFTGRRRLTLVETESSRWSDFVWNDGKHDYQAYRETVHFNALESVSLWLQNLPAQREVRVGVGAVQAIPMATHPLRDAVLTVNGQTLELPIPLPPGAWIEGNGPDDCMAYDAAGESLGKVEPRGAWPGLRKGLNALEFRGASEAGATLRARITTFHHGEFL